MSTSDSESSLEEDMEEQWKLHLQRTQQRGQQELQALRRVIEASSPEAPQEQRDPTAEAPGRDGGQRASSRACEARQSAGPAPLPRGAGRPPLPHPARGSTRPRSDGPQPAANAPPPPAAAAAQPHAPADTRDGGTGQEHAAVSPSDARGASETALREGRAEQPAESGATPGGAGDMGSGAPEDVVVAEALERWTRVTSWVSGHSSPAAGLSPERSAVGVEGAALAAELNATGRSSPPLDGNESAPVAPWPGSEALAEQEPQPRLRSVNGSNDCGRLPSKQMATGANGPPKLELRADVEQQSAAPGALTVGSEAAHPDKERSEGRRTAASLVQAEGDHARGGADAALQAYYEVQLAAQRDVRAELERALAAERRHASQLQAQLEGARRQQRSRLTAAEEGAIRDAHLRALERERSQAALAVREVKTLAERTAQGLDDAAAGRVDAARAIERQACEERVRAVSVDCHREVETLRAQLRIVERSLAEQHEHMQTALSAVRAAAQPPQLSVASEEALAAAGEENQRLARACTDAEAAAAQSARELADGRRALEASERELDALRGALDEARRDRERCEQGLEHAAEEIGALQAEMARVKERLAAREHTLRLRAQEVEKEARRLQSVCVDDAAAAKRATRDVVLAVLDALAPSKIAPVCTASFASPEAAAPRTPSTPVLRGCGLSPLLTPPSGSFATPEDVEGSSIAWDVDALTRLFRTDDFAAASAGSATPASLASVRSCGAPELSEPLTLDHSLYASLRTRLTASEAPSPGDVRAVLTRLAAFANRSAAAIEAATCAEGHCRAALAAAQAASAERGAAAERATAAAAEASASFAQRAAALDAREQEARIRQAQAEREAARLSRLLQDQHQELEALRFALQRRQPPAGRAAAPFQVRRDGSEPAASGLEEEPSYEALETKVGQLNAQAATDRQALLAADVQLELLRERLDLYEERAQQTADEVDELRELVTCHEAAIEAKDCRIDELRRALADAATSASDGSSQLAAERAGSRDASARAAALLNDAQRVEAAADAAMQRCADVEEQLCAAVKAKDSAEATSEAACRQMLAQARAAAATLTAARPSTVTEADATHASDAATRALRALEAALQSVACDGGGVAAVASAAAEAGACAFRAVVAALEAAGAEAAVLRREGGPEVRAALFQAVRDAHEALGERDGDASAPAATESVAQLAARLAASVQSAARRADDADARANAADEQLSALKRDLDATQGRCQAALEQLGGALADRDALAETLERLRGAAREELAAVRDDVRRALGASDAAQQEARRHVDSVLARSEGAVVEARAAAEAAQAKAAAAERDASAARAELTALADSHSAALDGAQARASAAEAVARELERKLEQSRAAVARAVARARCVASASLRSARGRRSAAAAVAKAAQKGAQGLQARGDALEAAARAGAAKLAKALHENGALVGQVAALEDKLARGDALRAKLDDRRSALELSWRRVQERAASLDEALAGAQRQLQEAQEREGAAQTQQERLRTRAEASERRGRELLEQLCRAEGALRDSQAAAARLLADVAAGSSREQGLQSQLQQMAEAALGRAAERELETAELEKTRARLSALSADLDAARCERDKAVAEAAALRGEGMTQRERLAESLSARDAAERRNREIVSRMELLIAEQAHTSCCACRESCATASSPTASDGTQAPLRAHTNAGAVDPKADRIAELRNAVARLLAEKHALEAAAETSAREIGSLRGELRAITARCGRLEAAHPAARLSRGLHQAAAGPAPLQEIDSAFQLVA